MYLVLRRLLLLAEAHCTTFSIFHAVALCATLLLVTEPRDAPALLVCGDNQPEGGQTNACRAVAQWVRSPLQELHVFLDFS